jgi:GcrA cell cycle regulator
MNYSNKNGVWTDDRIERLKAYWSAGLSGSQIARRLGAGISRNAVIGKVHRLGLPERFEPFRSAQVRQVVPRPAIVRSPPPEVMLLCPLATFAEGKTCRFIKGDPVQPDWQMCGQPGYPWCDGHRVVVFDIPRTKAAKASSEPQTPKKTTLDLLKVAWR